MKKENEYIKNIRKAINAYTKKYPDSMFVFRFVGYKPEGEPCVDCGEPCDVYDEDKSLVGAFGDSKELFKMLCEFREIIDGEKDEDDFVNF